MKKSNLLCALLIPAALLAGCATLYQKEGLFTNGYSDHKMAPDRFSITFRANEFTPADKVMEYALKRAAKLTLKHGYAYFVVIEETHKDKHIHYPSVRLTIQCYKEPPQGLRWVDARALA
jgi:hypothetical protein